jgi:excisionase family DNA binding protein
MTAAGVGDLPRIPTSTVYRLARNGPLPSARLGRTVRFLRDGVEGAAWIVTLAALDDLPLEPKQLRPFGCGPWPTANHPPPEHPAAAQR